jgi:hypothetical protein
MSDNKGNKGQKVIGYAIPEELYSRIQDTANKKEQKLSFYMRNFTMQYFTDNDSVIRVMLEIPKDKLNDKNYIKAYLAQKSQFILDNLCK